VRATGKRIGFVPTMGALHAGHVALVRQAKRDADICVASIFVNPKQFAANEDLDRYPRDEAGDAAKLAEAGCDFLYAPDRGVMYPPGFATAVSVSGVADGFEAAARPHFFNGVATVVAKLLIQVAPDVAVFGEKDYQQLLVVARMAADLDLPVRIVGAPIVREPDGLAMSSRNVYLAPEHRAIAPRLYALMTETAATIEAGGAVEAALSRLNAMLRESGFESIDYAALADAETLAPLSELDRPARLLIAARLGGVRLLDNMAVNPR
jgi:pantoate--beta-alanine ligase